MAINLTDFDKIWASSSPLTPYSFSDANYEEGWNFVGSTPPARQMWDGYMKRSDEKQQYIVNNFLPLAGGTMTGTLTLSDGGTALSNATVGTIVDDSTSSAVSIPQASVTTVVSINLNKGNWVITGHAYFSGSNVTADKLYSIGIGTTADSLSYGDDGTMTMHASYSGNLVLQTTRIMAIGSNNTTVYMCSLCNVATSIGVGRIRAIRIS